jgi:plastocyanin
MKKLGMTLMLAALVALFAVATSSARSAGGASVTAAQSSSHAADPGSGHDGSDDQGDDHGNHSEQGDDNGGQKGDDDGDRREAGEDVRGNCDEAEHANDAACLNAVTKPSTPTTTNTSTNTNTNQSKNKSGRRAGAKQLVASVGPGFSITLKTAAGAVVKTLPAGTYTVSVRDRSEEHNFHLTGRGVDKATSLGSVATSTWRVRLTAGTYTFKCDPHAQMMRGSIRVA